MATTHFQVSWDSYQNNISQGFSRLQHNEEFVDMTLAADGCLVKVHQNIFALSSPYIKAMLKSVDCKHPVIFLNNVNYEVLAYILEYIYTGKVNVPTSMLDSFAEASKALKIEGLENISSCIHTTNNHIDLSHNEPEKPTEPTTSNNNFAALITINEENNLEIQKCGMDYSTNVDNDASEKLLYEVLSIDTDQAINNVTNYEDKIPSNGHTEAETAGPNIRDTTNVIGFKLRDIELKPNYTISNRGALQLLLNRFMYLCHHTSHKGFKRRWRCIDYRRARCPAIIDTEGEIVTARKGIHNHPFHDQKILKKCKNSIVFSTISQAATENENGSKSQDKQSVD